MKELRNGIASLVRKYHISHLHDLVFRSSLFFKKKLQSPPDFSYIYKLGLQAGDFFLIKQSTGQLYNSVLKYVNPYEFYSHSAIMYDSKSVFEMALPQSQIIPLSDFLSHVHEIVIIRIKQRPPNFTQKLQEMINKRLGVPYSFAPMDLMMRRMILMRFFRIIKQSWRDESKIRLPKILKGQLEPCACSNEIIGALFPLLGDLRKQMHFIVPFFEAGIVSNFVPQELLRMAYFAPDIFEIISDKKLDIKALISSPIAPLVPDDLLLWRDKESVKDLPQMAKVLEVFINGISSQVERKMKRKEDKEWWDQTFNKMESVGQELMRIHSLASKHQLSGSEFVKTQKVLQEMIQQIGSPTENLPTALDMSLELLMLTLEGKPKPHL